MNKLVKALTHTKLPFEVIDKSIWEKLNKKPHKYVSARCLKSSSDMLLSENFTLCQAVVFLNGTIGALCHNFPSHDPYYTLTGQWSESEPNLEDTRKIFPERDKVKVIHIFHEDAYEWPDVWINGALKTVGMTDVTHIGIKTLPDKRSSWMYVGLDVKDRRLYIIPTEFEYGLSLKI